MSSSEAHGQVSRATFSLFCKMREAVLFFSKLTISPTLGVG